MLTPEQVAKEAADAAVTVTREGDGGSHHRIWIGTWHAFDWVEDDPAEDDAEDARRRLAPLFLAAVERALREVPVPTPMIAERLAQIRGDARKRAGSIGDAEADVEALLAHADHLTRALHDCGLDGTAAVWASGYEAGRAEADGVRAELAALRSAVSTLPPSFLDDVTDALARMKEGAATT